MFRPALILLLSACIILTAISCREKRQSPAVKTSAEPQQLETLYQKAKELENSSPDSLAVLGRQVVQIGTKHQDHRAIVRGEKYISLSFWKSGNHSAGMKYAVSALKNAEKWNVNSEIPDIYAIIGQLHKEKRNYDMAFDAVKKGMMFSKKMKDTSAIIQLSRMEAMFTQGVGSNSKDTSVIHHSMNMHLQAVKLAESSPKFERSRIGFYNNIAQVYVKRNQLDSAEFFVNKAIVLAKKYDQLSSLTFSYTWLSQVYQGRGNVDSSLYYMAKAVKISRDLQNPFREMELNDYLTAGLRQAGKYREALQAYTRYSTLRDSLQVLQNVRQVGEMQVKYDTEKKDRQIRTLSGVNELRSRQTIGALTVMGLFLILLVVLFYQYRVIRRNNLILADNNIRINEQSEKMQFLMKELHHRVKNNLQIVSNLLSIQGNRLADDNARRIIKAGQQRIETMSIIHKSLYSQDSSSMVDMREYISNLAESIMQSFGTEEDKIRFNMNVDIRELDVDIAMPLGLIINEWITNSFKHAFHYIENPEISLTLTEADGELHLEIRDNGPGFEEKKWEQSNRSFGVKLIKVLTRQLEGRCSVAQTSGACFRLNAPIKSTKLVIKNY